MPITLEVAERHLERIRQETAELQSALTVLQSQQDLINASQTHYDQIEGLLLTLQNQIAIVEETDNVTVKRRILELLVAGITVTTDLENPKAPSRIEANTRSTRSRLV